MKKGAIIKIHSLVDVITNSSTELFIGNTKKELSVVRNILNDYIEVYYKHNDTTEKTLDSICSVDIITEENLDYWINTLADWEIPYWVKIKSKEPEYLDYKDYNEYIDAHNKWVSKNYDNIKSGILGSVIIIGTNDNSIPYELFDMIESIFEQNSHRIHMG